MQISNMRPDFEAASRFEMFISQLLTKSCDFAAKNGLAGLARDGKGRRRMPAPPVRVAARSELVADRLHVGVGCGLLAAHTQPVQRTDIGLDRGEDGVGVGGRAGDDAAVLLHPDAHRRLRVGALGHRLHLIDLQLRLGRVDCLHRLEAGVDRAVTGAGRALLDAVDQHLQLGFLTVRTADHAQPFHLQVVVLGIGSAVRHQRDQILVIDLLLAVGERLEPHEDVVELVLGQIEAQILQLGAQRGAARMLAHRDVGLGDADIGGLHDLEGLDVLQHAVLMDARLVQEGVLADDRLVELHREARDLADAAAEVHDLRGVDAGGVGHQIATHLHRHHHLFECGVAGAFAQAVDRAFDLPRARGNGGERVRRRHAEVVVAMGGEDDLVGARHLFEQHRDDLGRFLRQGIADGIGNVDRRGAGLDRGLDHAAQVIAFGADRVHRRPLHVLAQVAGVVHGVGDALDHLVLIEVGDAAVARRGADEGVDTGARRVFHRLPAAVDVLVIRAREAADHRILGVLRDIGHRFEIAFRGDREAGLDDVDAHLVESLGNLQLLVMGHRRAGRLFAVTQGGVENQDTGFVGHVRSHGNVSSGSSLASGKPEGQRSRGLREGRALDTPERSRPKARSEAAKKKETTDGQAGGEGPGTVRRNVQHPCHGRGL
ncbi:hypothetical protein SDC9_41114 [bioreactor metagenome]|uniref:NAD-specific glutamate dehydrogenase n=1 Tax=bioreactor metagenome TaxID=1076179 RepID=A0A644VU75_9ZZZZ